MTRPTPLSPAHVQAQLAELPHWSLESGHLVRSFQFPDFRRAMAFWVAGALEAERLDHHPDWRNVYGKVWVRLWTHDAGAITELDFRLARALEAHGEALGASS